MPQAVPPPEQRPFNPKNPNFQGTAVSGKQAQPAQQGFFDNPFISFLSELPHAAQRTAAGVAQSIPRAAIRLGTSIADVARPGHDHTVTPRGKVAQFVLGSEPIKTMADEALDTSQSLQKYGLGSKTSDVLGIAYSVGKEFLDLYPLGELGKGISSSFVNATVKTDMSGSFVQRSFANLREGLSRVTDPGYLVQKSLGDEAYSAPQRMVNRSKVETLIFDNTKSSFLDKTFSEIEQHFNTTYSKQDLDNLMLSRGNPSTAEGQAVKFRATQDLHPDFTATNARQVMQEATDYAFNLAKKHGVELNYLEDYFRGNYSNKGGAVDRFLQYYKTTTAWTKQKLFPAYADAKAAGLTLKDVNPITNAKSELASIARYVGMKTMRDDFLNRGSAFIKPTSELTPAEATKWAQIHDPTFDGYRVDPQFARYVNNLIETNKVVHGANVVRSLRLTSRVQQAIRFLDPLFHYKTMFKASVTAEPGGILNPKGWIDFVKAHMHFDPTDPSHLKYVGLSGDFRGSMEQQGIDMFEDGMKKIGLGKLGSAHDYLFNHIISRLKEIKWLDESTDQAFKLGRSLTDAEHLDIIKRNQNIFGEMNEKLFGRSGTTTSALRLFFSAPGFAEGNFRIIGRALSGDLKSARFIAQSMATTVAAASIGTRILTGQWPDAPKNLNDIRDLMKINTGKQDVKGRNVYIDLADYDKDFYTSLLSLVNPGKGASALFQRVAGAESPVFKQATDLFMMMSGKPLVDNLGRRVFLDSDPMATKVQKFLAYEGVTSLPFPVQEYQQNKAKGQSGTESAVESVLGLRTTTSESDKDKGAARSQLFQLEDSKNQRQGELNTLYATDKNQAREQMKEFNQQQWETYKQLKEAAGQKPSRSEFDRYYSIKRVHAPKKLQ